jgi:TPR repeat protein
VLGAVYALGEGTAVDLQKSRRHTERACHLGDSQSCYARGMEAVDRRDRDGARLWLGRACDIGHREACQLIGR